MNIEFVSECYKSVPLDDLRHMFEEATERSEYTPDREERELWKQRMEGMKNALLRRQEMWEQIEV